VKHKLPAMITSLAAHVFVAEKGGHYEITDGLRQNEH